MPNLLHGFAEIWIIGRTQPRFADHSHDPAPRHDALDPAPARKGHEVYEGKVTKGAKGQRSRGQCPIMNYAD
jgi:hypothetical protein